MRRELEMSRGGWKINADLKPKNGSVPVSPDQGQKVGLGSKEFNGVYVFRKRKHKHAGGGTCRLVSLMRQRSEINQFHVVHS